MEFLNKFWTSRRCDGGGAIEKKRHPRPLPLRLSHLDSETNASLDQDNRYSSHLAVAAVERVASTFARSAVQSDELLIETATATSNSDDGGIIDDVEQDGRGLEVNPSTSVNQYNYIAHSVPGRRKEGQSSSPTNEMTIARASTMNSSTGMTHKRKSWLSHEGVPYQCTSTTKDGYARYSCTRYLPGGVPVSSHDAKWNSYRTAKDKSPNGVQPYRCPGKMLVNLETNIKTITVAHDCGLASPRATETAVMNKYSVPAPAIETTNLRVAATSIDKTPKNGSYLYREGVRYRCTSASDGCAEYRCYRFLPAGTSTSSQDSKWTGYKQAKKKKPSGMPYRCPGILIIDHEKDQTFISVAHECMRPIIVTEPSAAGEDVRIAFPSSVMNQAVPTTTQQATILEHQEEDTVHQKMMSVGASIAESLSCTQSLVHVPPRNLGSNADFDHKNDDNNYYFDDKDDDEKSDNENVDDVNSVASDKSFYKGLCVRLTGALVKKKREIDEYKQTIKRLKQRENRDPNNERSFEVHCSSKKNHRHSTDQYTFSSFSQKYA
jgi:hypothetical protein